MMSVFPASILPDPISDIPFPFLDAGFVPWDYPETDLLVDHLKFPEPGLISSPSSGSDASTLNHAVYSPVNASDEQKPKKTTPSSITDERKRRRMISNRESARRSRMRKQKHLENLRNQVNRLRIENRELTNKLRFVLYHCHGLRTDNARLMSEHFVLRQKLEMYRKLMMLQQQQQSFVPVVWPNNALISSEQIPSLIT